MNGEDLKIAIENSKLICRKLASTFNINEETIEYASLIFYMENDKNFSGHLILAVSA